MENSLPHESKENVMVKQCFLLRGFLSWSPSITTNTIFQELFREWAIHTHRCFCISVGWQLSIECYDVGQCYFIHNTQPSLAYIHIHENGEWVFVETITNGQNDFVQSPENVSYLCSQSHPGCLSSAAHGDAGNLELSLFLTDWFLYP